MKQPRGMAAIPGTRLLCSVWVEAGSAHWGRARGHLREGGATGCCTGRRQVEAHGRGPGNAPGRLLELLQRPQAGSQEVPSSSEWGSGPASLPCSSPALSPGPPRAAQPRAHGILWGGSPTQPGLPVLPRPRMHRGPLHACTWRWSSELLPGVVSSSVCSWKP